MRKKMMVTIGLFSLVLFSMSALATEASNTLELTINGVYGNNTTIEYNANSCAAGHVVGTPPNAIQMETTGGGGGISCAFTVSFNGTSPSKSFSLAVSQKETDYFNVDGNTGAVVNQSNGLLISCSVASSKYSTKPGLVIIDWISAPTPPAPGSYQCVDLKHG